MGDGYRRAESDRKIILQNIINAQIQPTNHWYGQEQNHWGFLVHIKLNKKVTQILRLNTKDINVTKKIKWRILIKLKKCSWASNGSYVLIETTLL